MRRRTPWLPLLLVGALTGCPLPQTVGTPSAEPTPTPTPSSTPEPPLQAQAITVRELALDENGLIRLEVDAREALVVLPLIEPQSFFVRLDTLPVETLPAYRTSALQRFSSPPAFRAPAPARRGMLAARSMEEAGGYGAEATFRVGEATVTAQQAYDGEHCLIYVDTRDAEEAAAKIMPIGQAFDTALYPKATQLLGTEPGGREADGFNRGDDRIVLLMSQASSGAAASFDPYDLFPAQDDGLSNFGKILHLNPDAPTEQLLPSLARELGAMVFLTQRLEAYSHMPGGEALPVGRDPAYLLDEEAQSDFWLHPLMSSLTELVCGYTPESGDRDALEAVGKYLELPSMYRLDAPSVERAYDSNRGQMLLFSAYLHGLKPDFAQGLGAVQALGTEALAIAMQQDFPQLFRDFSLATVLDGLEGVPARYSIPFVNLHHTYTLDGKPFPFTGAGASMAGVVGGNAALQTIMLRGRTSQDNLRLGISAGAARKAVLVLFRPSASARFIEE